MEKLLFIKISNSSFVVQDENLLKKHFVVTSFLSGGERGLQAIYNQLRLFIFLLINIWNSKIIYIWFADYHSLLPTAFAKLFLKKAYIVLGGFDVAKFKEINYGAHTSKFRSKIIKQSCRWAHKLIPVSKYVAKQANINIYPNAIDKSVIIYNAVDMSSYKLLNIERQNLIISVCGSNDESRARLKGVYHFIEIAKRKPEYNFALIGIGDSIIDDIKKRSSSNLEVIGILKKEHLNELYNKAKVICQFSTIESFGLAVAEAMACGCIPIVSNRGGLKEVVGKTGHLIERDNYLQIINSIEQAITNFDLQKEYCINRTKKLFSIEERETSIIDLLKPF